MTKEYRHDPVLLTEVIRYLDPCPGESYVDATLGGGGYTKVILEKIQPGGKLLAIDLDEDAIQNFQFSVSNFQTIHQSVHKTQTKKHLKSKILNLKSVILAHGNFRDIDKIVANHRFNGIAGIVADIGLSSYQLDGSGRGITFQKKELLDMRFDQSSTRDNAAFMVNNYGESQLVEIFTNYGEEKFAKAIARKIVGTRNQNKIQYTNELYNVIEQALPKPVRHKASDSARRVFQALRIAVNHELDNLEEFLPKAFDLLKPGGRLVVVSFHSLEDRMVKQYFNKLTKGCVCPPDFPHCICGKTQRGKLLTKKPVTASPEELRQNSRSKPAKLRAIQKI